MPKKSNLNLSVPQDLQEVDCWLAAIGEKQRSLETIEHNLNERIAKLTEATVKESSPIEQEIKLLFQGIFTYAQAHREALLQDRASKTVKLSAGDILWRWSQPAITLKNTEQVLANLKTLKLTRFIRLKEEINKEALLEEAAIAATIEGVSISRSESFVVKPHGISKEISKKIRLPLKKIASEDK